ncbi:MAG: phospho-N-acetylmuramoyl-pentapeptide-transferase [Syntrophomonadaceae bacterium]|jgi:phospho-N-acetylmuramoyl-pentapeptide-transferase
MMESIWHSIMAAAIAFAVTAAMGPVIIPVLTRLKFGQNIRDDGPQRHMVKAGTPTMGGVMIITGVMVATFIMVGSGLEALTAVLVMIALAAIGFWDDYIKVVLKRSLGLRAREKLGLQLLIGLLYGIFLIYYFNRGTDILIPFSAYSLDLGAAYVLFLMVVIISSSNAVNLTDGLDGLAAGVTFLVAGAYAVIGWYTMHPEITIFAGALVGACLGFLIFNHYPARVFMGDTGSMALGGAVAAMAALTKTELTLVIIGGVYVVETLSVALQVISYQTTRKRLFLMAPLHHHFELKGWSEQKVVGVFWLAALGFAVFGLCSMIPAFL